MGEPVSECVKYPDIEKGKSSLMEQKATINQCFVKF